MCLRPYKNTKGVREYDSFELEHVFAAEAEGKLGEIIVFNLP